jgi:hypothetical protein
MVEVEKIGNQVEFSLFDVFTDSYYVTQFQTIDEHKEVIHEANN